MRYINKIHIFKTRPATPEHTLESKDKGATAPKTLDPAEEAALMRAIAAGDRESFSIVVDRYMDQVYRFCYRMLGNSALAEDVTQDSFLKLWEAAAGWSPSGRLKNWLLRIAHNLCIDVLRAGKKFEPLDNHVLTLATPTPNPHQALHQWEAAIRVKEALVLLPERQRTALMLVHYSDCSNIETAAIMGISVEAVESLLARGKRGLKQMLGEGEREIFKEG